MRVKIPGTVGFKINLKIVFKLLKELIGKDLTRFSMPVFLNEPTNIIMKPAEFMFFNKFLTLAASESDPVKRMMYVAVN